MEYKQVQFSRADCFVPRNDGLGKVQDCLATRNNDVKPNAEFTVVLPLH